MTSRSTDSLIRASRRIALIAAIAAAYFAAAKLGLSLATVAKQVSVVWPPTGLSLAAVLLLGTRVWPGILLGAFIANATAEEPILTALGIAAGNTLEALAGAWLLRSAGFLKKLERFKDVLALVLLGAASSTTLSATAGVTSLCLGGVEPWEKFGRLWSVWWLGDAMGALVLAPCILSWAGRPWRSWTPARRLEGLALLAALSLVSWVVSTGQFAAAGPGEEIVDLTVFPFLIWAALRFGPPGVTLVTLVTSAIAVWGASRGLGPFAGRPPSESLVLLQVFMGVVAVTGMLLAAATSEREASSRRETVVHSVGRVLAGSESLDRGAASLLERISTALGMDRASLWVLEPDGASLRRACVHPPSAAGESGSEIGSGPGDRLRRRVLETGQPSWHAADDPAGGPRCVLAFGIRAGKMRRGVIELTRAGSEEPDEDLLSLLRALGDQIGLFLERAEVEAAFRESEARLRLAVEAGRMGAWEWIPATDRVVWSPSLEAIHGLEPGTFAGSFDAVLSEVHPDDREGFLRAIREGQEGRTGHHVEYRICLPDGSIRWVEGHGNLLLDAEGRPSRMVGVCSDITDRKEAEAKLRESEERFRAMAEAVPEIIFMTRADGSTEYLSPRFYKYTGFPEGAGEGFGWFDALHPEDAPRVQEAWMNAVARGSCFEIRYRFRSGSGEYRWFVDRAIPIRDRAGVVIRWFGASTDVHDLVVAQEGLRAADRRKDEFLAMLAHELRNPLAPIRNAAQVLRLLGEEERASRQAREVIERQVEHLGRLVDDLLDVSRIMTGKIDLRREIVDAAAVIEHAVETVEPLIRGRRQDLKVSLPEEPILLEGDVTRLAQVLGNLLSNAAKYTPEGGSVALSAGRGEGEMTFRVKDTGRGIPPDMLGEIFDLFTQVGRSLDRAQGGLGIGLTLVRGLVQMHGGTVEAFSEGAGKGSEFVVRLPLTPGGDRPGRAERPAAARAAPRRILVVDDNIDAAETLAKVLELRRHEVRTANDGTSALRVASDFLPDIVLLDIGLPDLNGFEVARRLRREPGSRPILLVAVTGYGQQEDRRRAMEAGFDHHLVKPVLPDLLDDIIAGAPRREAPPAEEVTLPPAPPASPAR